MNNPNLAILELVAQALGPVCDEVVFVGGCATGLQAALEKFKLIAGDLGVEVP